MTGRGESWEVQIRYVWIPDSPLSALPVPYSGGYFACTSAS